MKVYWKALASNLTPWCFPYAGITYAIGETTHRRGGWGRMTVFATREDAERFIQQRGSPQEAYVLASCHVTGASKNIKPSMLFNPHYTYTGELPKGTVLCSSVTLLTTEIITVGEKT